MKNSIFLLLTLFLLPAVSYGGGAGGGSTGAPLQLTKEELTEINVILQEQEVAYIQTESRTVEISKSNFKLKAIDVDTFETIKLELTE